MTITEKRAVLDAANAARAAGRKAHHAAITARPRSFNAADADEAEKAAMHAYRAAQAAEDAALGLDPNEALENEDVWNTHCIAMGAAHFARKAADAALHSTK